jgi:hypothetical protein
MPLLGSGNILRLEPEHLVARGEDVGGQPAPGEEPRVSKADAIEIRMRATRRLDQLRQAQKETVGLSAGARGSRVKGARVDDKPTLASQGLDKILSCRNPPDLHPWTRYYA